MREPLTIGAVLLILAVAPARPDTASPQELCLDPRAAGIPWITGAGERQPPGIIYHTQEPVTRLLLDLPPVQWTEIVRREPKPPVDIAPVPLVGSAVALVGALVLGAVVMGRRK